MRQAAAAVKGQSCSVFSGMNVHVMFMLCRGAEMAIFRVVVACLLLFGCSVETAVFYGVPMVAPADRPQVARHILVRHDPHIGSTEVIGPLIHQRWGRSSYQIRSWTNTGDRKIDNRFQIVVTGRFPKRVYLKQAYAEGAKLDTIVIDRERIACGAACEVEETVGIGLTEDEMARRAATGMSFKILGRRASLVIAIPPAYFAATLDAHRAARGGTMLPPQATPRSGASPAGRPDATRPASSPA